MAPNSSLSEREAALRRRRLRWILENGGATSRRRFRNRVRSWQWLTQMLLALTVALAVLGVAYEFFC